MEVTNIIINVSISLVVGGGAGFCAFKWLGQKWVNNWFAKDLEKYKQQLEILKVKDEIRFNILHKERLETVKKLYSLINDLNDTVAYLMIPTKMAEGTDLNYNELIKTVKVKHHIIVQYLMESQIYLPQSLVDRIAGMGYSLNKVADYCLEHNNDESREWLRKVNEDKLRPLLNSLRDEFRKLLGVENDE